MVDTTPNRGLNKPPKGFFARPKLGGLIRSNLETLDATSGVVVENVTASGDGTATVFTFSHSLGAVPSGVALQPTSADAAGDHYRSNVTDTSVEVTFAAAPASGTDNIVFELALIE